MYDDLVKRLRDAAKMSDALAVLLPNSEGNATAKLFNEAADSIEELQKAVNFHKFNSEFWEDKYNSLADEKWIPVGERLPEKMQYVLVRYKNNDMAVASWFGGDEDIIFWRAITDEGWCADCDTEPTHWMPLPEPPEEET